MLHVGQRFLAPPQLVGVRTAGDGSRPGSIGGRGLGPHALGQSPRRDFGAIAWQGIRRGAQLGRPTGQGRRCIPFRPAARVMPFENGLLGRGLTKGAAGTARMVFVGRSSGIKEATWTRGPCFCPAG